MSLLHQNPPPFPRLFAYGSDPEDTRRWPNWSRIPLGWRVFGIFLLCLIPRMVMACLVRSACHDGYYYISIAASCQKGNWAEALGYLNLNLYPLILSGLHSLGLEWVMAGKVWSVLLSSLAVLPLFGWVRRLFSDQVAWAACFLYSIHAEFLEFSMEPARDPTFWFLFNFCLYATLRAISEVKLRWFLTGGLALALAVHIRSEGWLLLIPFVMWLARQLVVNSSLRGRLAIGGGVWLAVTPVLIVLINVTMLRDEPEWKLGRLTHFAVGWTWVKNQMTPADLPPEPAQTEVASSSPESPAINQVEPFAPPLEPVSVKRYLKELASALEQFHLILLALGAYWLWREMWAWDRVPLFLMSYALAGAVWIYYDHYGFMNGRYFYPIYLALSPYFATGLLFIWNALWERAREKEWSWVKPQYTAVFILCFGISAGWIDAFTTYHNVRERETDLGEWLGETHGPFQSVATDLRSSRAGYHVHNTIPKILHNWGSLEWQYLDHDFDLLILSCVTTPPEAHPLVESAARRLGLEPITLPEDHEARHRFLIFIRPPEKPCDPPTHSLATQTQPDKESPHQ